VARAVGLCGKLQRAGARFCIARNAFCTGTSVAASAWLPLLASTIPAFTPPNASRREASSSGLSFTIRMLGAAVSISDLGGVLQAACGIVDGAALTQA